jgi:hypothetical protein
MPTPSAEHAPTMRQMSDEILKVFPTASVFAWKVMHRYTIWPMDRPHVYVLAMHDADGEWIGGEQLNSPENQIVARYEDVLDWSSREEGLAFAYSVTEAREITDVEGMGTLDSGFEGHPGLLGIFGP